MKLTLVMNGKSDWIAKRKFGIEILKSSTFLYSTCMGISSITLTHFKAAGKCHFCSLFYSGFSISTLKLIWRIIMYTEVYGVKQGRGELNWKATEGVFFAGVAASED